LRCSAGRGPFRACGVVFSRLYSPSGAPGGQGAVAAAPTAAPISTSSAAIDRARPDRCGGAAGAALSQGRRGAGAAGLRAHPVRPTRSFHAARRPTCYTAAQRAFASRATGGRRCVSSASARSGRASSCGGAPGDAWGVVFLAHPVRSAHPYAAHSTCYHPRNSVVRGGSCRSAGQYWRAPRPVSPGTATLMADARCARRSADALNELRPLRQRVSRAAGICLPAAAAGCERSLARRCRQSAA